MEIFSSGEDLCSDLECGEYYDIIFLDIELKKINGVEVGKKIREELNDNMVQIIYISSYRKYAQQLFAVRPIQFLEKPLSDSIIEIMLAKAISLMNYEEQFIYQINKSYYKVPTKNILYFRSLQSRVEMVCTDQCVIFYSTLENIYEKLHSNHFFYCHRSYLVNFSHIICFHPHEIMLSNGESLPLGRYQEKEIQTYKELFIGIPKAQ